jgi:mercuric ion binding protein
MAMDTITLSVPTVHCRSCKLNIEESLEEVAGVSSSDVDVDAKQVTVTFDGAAVEPAAIRSAIETAGYPVEA